MKKSSVIICFVSNINIHYVAVTVLFCCLIYFIIKHNSASPNENKLTKLFPNRFLEHSPCVPFGQTNIVLPQNHTVGLAAQDALRSTTCFSIAELHCFHRNQPMNGLVNQKYCENKINS